MNFFATILLALNGIALWTLPRRWASVPLLIGAFYVTLAQTLEIGPFHFQFIRMLLLLGVIRTVVRRENLAGGLNKLDKVLIAWGLWSLCSSVFHEDPTAALISRLGTAYNALFTYYLFRVFCRSWEDVLAILHAIAILIIPVAVLMIYEKATGHNLFSIFGGVSPVSVVREGKVRAQGPFSHPILAGTVAASCFPLLIGIWRENRRLATLGIIGSLGMVYASTSSGPIMVVLAAAVGFWFWRFRWKMRSVRWAILLGYIGLDLVMKAPAYFLLARIDITGGSTGWHRAKLIESAIRTLGGWWFAGTDYTRDWMPYGVPWSGDQTDITNEYLQMGVRGGLPLMLLFIAALTFGFSFVGRGLRSSHGGYRFLVWSIGVSLFCHVTAFFSITYFDQSFIAIYLTLALCGSLPSVISSTCNRISKKVLFAEAPEEPEDAAPAFGSNSSSSFRIGRLALARYSGVAT